MNYLKAILLLSIMVLMLIVSGCEQKPYKKIIINNCKEIVFKNNFNNNSTVVYLQSSNQSILLNFKGNVLFDCKSLHKKNNV